MNTHPLPPLKDAPDPRYLVIGSALRHARLQARKSLQEASDALEPSPGRSRGPVRGRTISQLSRVETGKCPPWADVVEKLLHHYAYPPDLANELIAMAANWAQSTPNTLHDPAPGWNVRLGIVEGAATHLRTFASLYVPPAVRTPDYGNALRDAELTLDGEEERPRARSLRADALTMILEWSVLERAVGGQAVMAGQLKHLRALTTAGRLRLRILPNRHGVYGPSCAVMTQMVVHDQCLFVAEGGWAIYMTGPGAGGNCAARLDALGNAACSEPESLDLLDTAITRFERQAVRAGGAT
ncbi:Scr1 family TA system antitoxin-like transcriptional regulator [Streptomyces noursei]|uniref:Scr1 family TA system antitoxin-like transcriptional regulator n=1 Tax=Streptomyces noursei TaxID=1971 RepID=UPI000C9A5E8F|nr:Scr1 family TA system antitoxin-like transcriptional regulator [Streptomyces noursei]